MTENQAKEKGFTHNGKYFLIPCYLNPYTEPMMMAEKHWIFIPITFFFTGLEWIYNHFIDEDFDDAGFMFKVMGKIK